MNNADNNNAPAPALAAAEKRTRKQAAADGLAKIVAIRADLNAQVLEQSEAVDAVLVGLLSGEHVALIGPAGEAKSHLAALATSYFPGATFSRLLSRFSTPDDVFGPYSLAALQRDEHKRNPSGMATDSEFVILDEAFKANTPMLNALLGLLNEGVVDGIKAKTLGAIALSNEYPRALASGRSGDDESLYPLWDRFGLRVEIGRLRRDVSKRRIFRGDLPKPTAAPLDFEEFEALRAVVDLASRNADQRIEDAVIALDAELASRGVEVSARRLRKSARILGAAAVVNGRAKITRSDLKILRHAFWSRPEERDVVFEALISTGDENVSIALQAEAEIAAEFNDYAGKQGAERAASREKLSLKIVREVKSLSKVQDESDDPDEIARVVATIKGFGLELQREALKAYDYLNG